MYSKSYFVEQFAFSVPKNLLRPGEISASMSVVMFCIFPGSLSTTSREGTNLLHLTKGETCRRGRAIAMVKVRENNYPVAVFLEKMQHVGVELNRGQLMGTWVTLPCCDGLMPSQLLYISGK